MSSANFGQNEWLVDQMYQQYKKDPESVDPEWRKYFEKNGDTAGSSAGADNGAATSTQSAPAASAGAATATSGRRGGLRGDADERVIEAYDAIPKRVAPPEPKHPVEAPEAGEQVLRGAARAIAKNMDASLSIPTATTVRDMPAKLMFENRAIINQ